MIITGAKNYEVRTQIKRPPVPRRDIVTGETFLHAVPLLKVNEVDCGAESLTVREFLQV